MRDYQLGNECRKVIYQRSSRQAACLIVREYLPDIPSYPPIGHVAGTTAQDQAGGHHFLPARIIAVIAGPMPTVPYSLSSSA